MIKSLSFVLRIAIAWLLAIFLVAGIWAQLPLLGRLEWPIAIAGMATMALVVAGALSHLGRVRLIAGTIDKDALDNRQRRQVEIPFEAGEAFDLVDAAIRELPRVQQVESARDSLQVRAKVGRADPRRRAAGRALESAVVVRHAAQPDPGHGHARRRQRQRHADLRAGDAARGATGSWSTTAPTSRMPRPSRARSRAASPSAAATRRPRPRRPSTEKELTVAKLSLLHAQVEPHFLYNTLASAQLLTRSDPARADEMLGHLITVPAPFAAAHRGCAVDARRGTRARAALTSKS